MLQLRCANLGATFNFASDAALVRVHFTWSDSSSNLSTISTTSGNRTFSFNINSIRSASLTLTPTLP